MTSVAPPYRFPVEHYWAGSAVDQPASFLQEAAFAEPWLLRSPPFPEVLETHQSLKRSRAEFEPCTHCSLWRPETVKRPCLLTHWDQNKTLSSAHESPKTFITQDCPEEKQELFILEDHGMAFSPPLYEYDDSEFVANVQTDWSKIGLDESSLYGPARQPDPLIDFPLNSSTVPRFTESHGPVSYGFEVNAHETSYSGSVDGIYGEESGRFIGAVGLYDHAPREEGPSPYLLAVISSIRTEHKS
eukprot:Gregarina_sp_Poly_1__7104@NODE_388_length_8987_cov_115_762892_g317_i0_p5_GENE_NODE_388_length_8987_cov_115_762892_g317_i0NODE_388_length_8987_cov_115_762892_g317_i0_p5_ORF_typecomplete_len244_score33_04_NODE_388_length_8987_cov_115_762892_g317_i05901321